MTLNFNHRKDELIFLPLGGSGEIGMNLNLYHYKGQWLMVDCGAGFAEDFLPGIDMIVPDISFIATIRDKLLGIVLTHAHEDHLGAVQYLWDDLRCPIYTTKFSASFLKAKLTDSGSSFIKDMKINEVPSSGNFSIGPFDIELVQLTHSTPEMNALVIRTDAGNVFHTGDWKFDPDPMIGPAADEARLKALGEEGILAMIGDSTNVFKDGVSGSEGELRQSLIELIGQCPQAVAVATFASNVARIETIAYAAKAHNRKIVLAGRSLWRIMRAAQESGYLKDIDFLDDRQASKYPRKDLLILCTGCQGEPLAVTNKLAKGEHPTLKLLPGDTVIFSSKIIPGNDKKIFRLFNKFVQLGIEVITEKDHFVHVSGHPSRQELKRMYELVRPKVAVPVHGERVHMHEHAKLAKQWGVPHAVQVDNGDVVRLGPGEAEKIGTVKAGFLGIDGFSLLAPDSNVMRIRRRIQQAGAVCITLVMNSRDQLLADPVISAPGSLSREEDRDLFEELSDGITAALNGTRSSKNKRPGSKTETIENQVRGAVRSFYRNAMGKEPVVDVQVAWVD